MHDATFNSNAKSGTLLFACAPYGSGETDEGIEPVDLRTHFVKVIDRITGLEPLPATRSNQCASTLLMIGRLNGSVDMFRTFH